MFLSFSVYILDPIGENISMIRPNKKISVFRVKGLKILVVVGTHIFFNHFFLEKI